ncbi:MAG: serine protease, partial [Candidatus Obscuribacterales bacterium]|nr:serine protease [Candidatus Obscuribacterales bacterium]
GNLSFLITCKHVLDHKNSVRLRFNGKAAQAGQSINYSIKRQGADKNILPASDASVDLAALYLDKIPEKADLHPIDPSEILDESKWNAQDIGEGTEIFTVGPVYGYPGKARNTPALRFGRIAQINPEKWYNERVESVFEKAFLTDINLTHGTSGSPVFLLPANSLSNEKKIAIQPKDSLIVLGVVKGAPDVVAGQFLNAEPSLEIPQAVSACEPASSLRSFIKEISKEITAKGFVLEKNVQQLLSR